LNPGSWYRSPMRQLSQHGEHKLGCVQAYTKGNVTHYNMHFDLQTAKRKIRIKETLCQLPEETPVTLE